MGSQMENFVITYKGGLGRISYDIKDTPLLHVLTIETRSDNALAESRALRFKALTELRKTAPFQDLPEPVCIDVWVNGKDKEHEPGKHIFYDHLFMPDSGQTLDSLRKLIGRNMLLKDTTKTVLGGKEFPVDCVLREIANWSGNGKDEESYYKKIDLLIRTRASKNNLKSKYGADREFFSTLNGEIKEANPAFPPVIRYFPSLEVTDSREVLHFDFDVGFLCNPGPIVNLLSSYFGHATLQSNIGNEAKIFRILKRLLCGLYVRCTYVPVKEDKPLGNSRVLEEGEVLSKGRRCQIRDLCRPGDVPAFIAIANGGKKRYTVSKYFRECEFSISILRGFYLFFYTSNQQRQKPEIPPSPFC